MKEDRAIGMLFSSIVAKAFRRAELTIGMWDLKRLEGFSVVYCSLDISSAGLRREAVASRILSERAMPQLSAMKGMEEICLDPLLVYSSLVILSFFSKIVQYST